MIELPVTGKNKNQGNNGGLRENEIRNRYL